MNRIDLTTVISADNDCLNIVFNDKGESVILLCNTEKKPTIHRIEENQRIKNIIFEEIKNQAIKEHIEYFLNCMDSLLKLGKDFEYINEFIEKEILSCNNG
jgi:hypothetical protein